MNLKDLKYVYSSIERGIRWSGDVKRIALNVTRFKNLGWNPG